MDGNNLVKPVLDIVDQREESVRLILYFEKFEPNLKYWAG